MTKMTTCNDLKQQHDQLYREKISFEKEENHIKDRIHRIETEIQKLEKQWKNDASQRGFRDIVKPTAKALEKLSTFARIIDMDKTTYQASPDRAQNAITYNYIESLRDEVKSYNMRLRNIQKNINELDIQLFMIKREMISLEC